MALGGFIGLWLVAMDMFDCEEGPSNVVSIVYGLHPCGFYWVPADGRHPLDALCNGCYLVDIIGHPLFSLFYVERGMGMVGVVGRMV